MSDTPYRRHTSPVHVGNIVIGSDVDIVPQSMTTTPTLDTEASVAQVKALAKAGAKLVRLTAQSIAHAANLADIKSRLRGRRLRRAIGGRQYTSCRQWL